MFARPLAVPMVNAKLTSRNHCRPMVAYCTRFSRLCACIQNRQAVLRCNDCNSFALLYPQLCSLLYFSYCICVLCLVCFIITEFAAVYRKIDITI